MFDHATVFISDGGFLVPTIRAALQVVEQNAETDVLVLLVDLPPTVVERLQDAFGPAGLTIMEIDEREFPEISSTRLSNTHITAATVGRLFLDALLPPRYSDILYLDGDIEIVGDIRPLVELRVEEGWIAAARDTIWMFEASDTDYGRRLRAYRERLLHGNGERYFNAGILAFKRSTWSEIGPKAWKHYVEHQQDCLFFDQSALNSVVAGRIKWLPVTYNFQTHLRMMGVELLVRPRIRHFTGRIKPWITPFNPWGWRTFRRYADFVAANQVVAPYLKVAPKTHVRSLRNQLLVEIWKEVPGLRSPAILARRWRSVRRLLASDPQDIGRTKRLAGHRDGAAPSSGTLEEVDDPGFRG